MWRNFGLSSVAGIGFDWFSGVTAGMLKGDSSDWLIDCFDCDFVFFLVAGRLIDWLID